MACSIFNYLYVIKLIFLFTLFSPYPVKHYFAKQWCAKSFYIGTCTSAHDEYWKAWFLLNITLSTVFVCLYAVKGNKNSLSLTPQNWGLIDGFQDMGCCHHEILMMNTKQYHKIACTNSTTANNNRWIQE